MVDFRGVQLARVGRFEASTGTVTFTRQDFDNAAIAHKALGVKFEAPIKLGHAHAQKLLQSEGLPNAGVLANVRRDGDYLVADLVSVPDAVAALVKAGRYAKRSIEALKNVVIADKRWPFVLSGLAFLGAELPAVDSLNDLTKLYASAGELSDNDARIEFTDDELVDDEASRVYVFADGKLVEAAGDPPSLESLVGKAEALLAQIDAAAKGRKGSPALRSAGRALVAELRNVSKFKANRSEEDHDVDSKAIAAKLGLPEDATEEQILAKLDEHKPDPKPDPQPGDDRTAEEIRALREELDAEKEAREKDRVDAAKATATAKVDEAIRAGRILPAQREESVDFAVNSPEGFEKFIASARVIPLEERGTSEEGVSAAESEVMEKYALTQIDRDLAATTGADLDLVLAQKIVDGGDAARMPAALREKVDKIHTERIEAARKAHGG